MLWLSAYLSYFLYASPYCKFYCTINLLIKFPNFHGKKIPGLESGFLSGFRFLYFQWWYKPENWRDNTIKHEEFKNGICKPFFQNPCHSFFANQHKWESYYKKWKLSSSKFIFWMMNDESAQKWAQNCLAFIFLKYNSHLCWVAKKLWYGFLQNGLQIIFLNFSC